MHRLFRGRLSPIGIAILTAEIALLSGCSSGAVTKLAFWRTPNKAETSEGETPSAVDKSRYNSYLSRQHPLSPTEKPQKVAPKQARIPTKAGMPTSATAAGDWGAIALLGEIAPRNFRGSTTYGVYFTPTQRFKISGEYLTQNLDFHFSSGHHKKWVSQAAVGAEYQYLLNNRCFKSIEMGTAYSHAFRTHHHISDSNASLSFLGTTARLWTCAFLSLAGEYDWVEFDRKHRHDKSSNGFGGSVDFVQQFGKDFSLNLGAQFREPFNSYQGLLNWNHRFSQCNLDIGVFGNLTEGHDGVRDIRTVGLQLGISFGPKPKTCGRSVEMSASGRNCYARQYCDVSQWVASPAVYVPIVLVIADEKKPSPSMNCNGQAPTLTGAPLDIFFSPIPPVNSVDTSVAFASSLPLTYSLVIDPATPLPPGDTLTIDPTTGLLTATNLGTHATINISITATNACGASVTLVTTALFDSP